MHGRGHATGARWGATALLLIATPLQAQVCNGETAPIAADGRMLGHLPYGEASEVDLVDAPPGFALNACRVRREVLPDLQRLVWAAATDPSVGGTIRGLSCHRTLMSQTAVFCREVDTQAGDRAISVAPPGHSEHSTGFAIDFAIRPNNGCRDAEACMAALPAARWLRDNAPRFGFEQSFPSGNTQRVKWEPWHWRWVGRTARTPGAARARFFFARARAEFPANPGVVEPPRVFRTIAEVAPAPPVVKDKSKRRRRR